MAIQERELLARVERADTEELARLLSRPSADEARALEAYFGPETYERLRQLAMRERTRGPLDKPRGNVVVLHGILGGELTAQNPGESPAGIWVNVWRLLRGGFVKLSLDPADKPPAIEATGILKKYYGEQLLTLAAQGYAVRAYWYDWRLDIRELARRLSLRLEEWFPGQPVHLVAHSMGGLVARRYILDYHADWQRRKGGKLVMLGTPNHGSFAIPQLFSGMNSILKFLSAVDLGNSLSRYLRVIRTFPSAYQMMPRPDFLQGAEAEIWNLASYTVTPEQRLLDNAGRFWKEMANDRTADPERMIYVAGVNKPTAVAVKDVAKLGKSAGYEFSMEGDGTVPHRLSFLENSKGEKVPVYYADVEHDKMPNAEAVRDSVAALLDGTGAGKLRKEKRLQTLRARDGARAGFEAAERETEARIRELARRIEVRGGDAEPPPMLTREETEAEEILLSGFLGAERGAGAARPGAGDGDGGPKATRTIRVRVRNWPVEEAGERWRKSVDPAPVDVLAAGHYINVLPSASEGAIDRAISAKDNAELGRIAELTRRGAIHGMPGEIFVLEDPRSKDSSRVVMLAGMGFQGQFGWPELRSLARQLLWTASRLGKRHVATVLIGAGEGNLPIDQAVHAWVRGIEDAVQDSSLGRCVESVTFCEFQAERTLELDRLFASQIAQRGSGRWIRLERLSSAERKRIAADWVKRKERKHAEEIAWIQSSGGEWSKPNDRQLTVNRLLVGKTADGYSFAAIQRTASVPERRIPLDARLVEEANDRFPALTTREEQFRHGSVFKRLVMPAEFDRVLTTPEPLILVVDSTTARIHWEMVAHVEGRGQATGGGEAFLGLQRGLTRQFRTTLAGLTQGPVAGDGVLRMLLVADPALEHPLAGAELEAAEIVKLMRAFGEHLRGNPAKARRIQRVEVRALVGPSEATRLRVLEELMTSRYDILHYAGHCFYDKVNPERSGWIFSGGAVLSANELRRIGQAPAFVFSNACESGITPDRSEQRTAQLPASFAESFFEQGVQNFVCTGWPVGDQAALLFAKTLYESWLGIGTGQGEPLYEAMRKAREAIFREEFGRRTWGAYQHYGDPDTRLY